MKILILDDDPERHAGFRKAFPVADRTHVLKYSEAIKALDDEVFDTVFLDHDLADFGEADTMPNSSLYAPPEAKEYTGYDVAWYIARKMPQERWPHIIVIHSWNPEGARAMSQVLLAAGLPVVIRSPYQAP